MTCRVRDAGNTYLRLNIIKIKNKRSGFIRSFPKSIFTKILVIIAAISIIIPLLIGSFFSVHQASNHWAPLHRNLKIYSEYIINDIGIPPDLKKARSIAERTALEIKINGRDIDWISSESTYKIKFWHLVHVENDDIGWHRGRIKFTTSKNGYTYTFTSKPMKHEFDYLFYILIGAVILILALCYLFIRKTLKPVKYLSKGVDETAKGNFSYRIPVLGRDELSRLSESFNTMNAKIGSMISAKQQLLLDVSHELRSPLTRIKVALEFIPEGKARESIGEDILSLEKMISEILESERLNHEGGKLITEEINLPSFIKDIINEYGNSTGIAFREEEMRDIIIKADRERLHTVFKNILDNALKYSGTAGRPVDINYNTEDPFHVITIQDYGKGIPEEDLQFIFEPFYRVDRSRSKETGGYGLGLGLCRKIMEAHGGSIEIKSSAGKGTAVVLKFPA